MAAKTNKAKSINTLWKQWLELVVPEDPAAAVVAGVLDPTAVTVAGKWNHILTVTDQAGGTDRVKVQGRPTPTGAWSDITTSPLTASMGAGVYPFTGSYDALRIQFVVHTQTTLFAYLQSRY
jgi:hypothetical protein